MTMASTFAPEFSSSAAGDDLILRETSEPISSQTFTYESKEESSDTHKSSGWLAATSATSALVDLFAQDDDETWAIQRYLGGAVESDWGSADISGVSYLIWDVAARNALDDDVGIPHSNVISIGELTFEL